MLSGEEEQKAFRQRLMLNVGLRQRGAGLPGGADLHVRPVREMMYEAFFGLRERPFDLTPNPRFLVLTESHREVLLNLEYGIASRKGITLLIGEAGSGKTTVIRAAIERQPVKVHCVHLHNPTLTRTEFNEMLARAVRAFGARPRSRRPRCSPSSRRCCAQRQAEDEKTVLIVDEAQSLPLELLEEIRLLANIETNDEKLMSVIIAGQPELATRLNDRALRQFKQRVALRCELRPLTRRKPRRTSSAASAPRAAWRPRSSPARRSR